MGSRRCLHRLLFEFAQLPRLLSPQLLEVFPTSSLANVNILNRVGGRIDLNHVFSVQLLLGLVLILDQRIVSFAKSLAFLVFMGLFQYEFDSLPLGLFASTSSQWLKFPLGFGARVDLFLRGRRLFGILGRLKLLFEVLKSRRYLLLFFRDRFGIDFWFLEVSFRFLF